MRRSERRETIFRLLYMRQFYTEDELAEQITQYLNSVRGGLEEVPADGQISEAEEEELRHTLQAIAQKIPEIDEALNAASRGWKTSRMGKVDLTILRLAVYEIRYDPEVPLRVAINEAVEIAKKYGGEETAGFVNGILGQIAREQEPSSESEA